MLAAQVGHHADVVRHDCPGGRPGRHLRGAHRFADRLARFQHTQRRAARGDRRRRGLRHGGHRRWTRPGTDPESAAPVCRTRLRTTISARAGLLISQRSHTGWSGAGGADAVAVTQSGHLAARLGTGGRLRTRRRRHPLPH